jgi:hypothetical protein
MQRIKILIVILPLILLFNSFQNDMKKSNVLICYGKLNPELIKGYKYVIVESKHYFASNVRVLKSKNEKVLSYISLGEVNENASHFLELKKHTLGKNEIWNSYYLDLNSKKTIETLMHIIDETFANGYDGVFLDNFDNFTIHGPQKSQHEALINLLKTIKEKYPKKMFIQNAGLDMVNETSMYIDAIAIESIATDYSFKEKKYSLRDQKQFEMNMNRIDGINKIYNIPFILIEYADTKDLMTKICNRIDNSKHQYFIGNINLQTIPKFK